MTPRQIELARRDYTSSLGFVLFHLTRAGAERALLPGDVLDPEDWGPR